MERSVFESLKKTEENHWWFVGRRAIVKRALDNIAKDHNINTILEIGCGTGGNFELLRKYGELDAIELDEDAQHFSRERNIATLVSGGSLPNNLPDTLKKEYDLIVMCDVLEHIEEDEESLAVLRDKLSENGTLLITVPAYQWLWSTADDIYHHKRRYTLNELTQKCKNADLTPATKGYFNFWTFPLAVCVLSLQKLKRSKIAETDKPIGSNIPMQPINFILKSLFVSEKFTFGTIPFPFGLSVLMTATKNTTTN